MVSSTSLALFQSIVLELLAFLVSLCPSNSIKNHHMKDNNINLNLAVIPQEFLSRVESELQELKTILIEKSESERASEWIESVKIPKLLGITRKTWQVYRDKRMIPFSQVGSKIFVKKADLDKFLNSHYIDKN